MAYSAPKLPSHERVRQLLRDRRIPQRRLATSCDLGESVISSYLRGTYAPGALMAHKLLHGLRELGLLDTEAAR